MVFMPLFDDEVPPGRDESERIAGPLIAATVAVTRAIVDDAGIGVGEVVGVFPLRSRSRCTCPPRLWPAPVRYRVAGRCSALQGGGEGLRWEGRSGRDVARVCAAHQVRSSGPSSAVGRSTRNTEPRPGVVSSSTRPP